MSKKPEEFVRIEVVKIWPVCPSCDGEGNPDINDFCPACYTTQNITPLSMQIKKIQAALDILIHKHAEHTTRLAMKRGPLRHICTVCNYSGPVGLDIVRHIEEAHGAQLERPLPSKGERKGGGERKKKDDGVTEEAL